MPRFVASGRARFESDRGDVDGRVDIRVDPPGRLWLEVRADALFGLVGERVIVCMPGDGWLLTYEERADRIERVRIDDSWLADLAPGGGFERVLELATARLPWPDSAPAPAPRPAGDRLEIDLAPAGSAGTLRVVPGSHLLRRLEWRQDDRTRLEVDYGEPLPCGADWLPSRLRGRAGDVRVDLRIDRVEPRSSFADSDFDLLGTPGGGDG